MTRSRPTPALPTGRAICYSGYRAGQSPRTQVYPSVDEIRADLRLLGTDWPLLRLYDASLHAERVLEAIRLEGLPLQVLLGADFAAEQNNPGCPWGVPCPDAELEANARANDAEVDRLIALANAHADRVFAVAVGNETTADWTDHVVSVERMRHQVRRVKAAVRQPVTFCENYVPWQHKLLGLAEDLDFISLHTYPVWEYKQVHDALAYTQANYESVRRLYPDKPVVITEAGWATTSNGRGIPAHHASQDLQQVYLQDLLAWSDAEGILTFVFEAFDEPWKGSDDPHEPEKHWGLYTVDRQPKRAIQAQAAIST